MRKRQNFVFSATLSLVHDLPRHLVGKKRARPVTAEEKLEQVRVCETVLSLFAR